MAVRRREIRDPRVLRALAHPFRLTLLDLVEREGTLTSAEASAATGESTASCSFHLRQLAKYGYLEPGAGRDGRERRWKRTGPVDHVGESSDPAYARAASQTLGVILDRLADEALRWAETNADLPRAWRQGSVVDDELLYLDPSELRDLSREILDAFARYRSRTADPSSRPPGARAVRTAALLFPLAEDDRA